MSLISSITTGPIRRGSAPSLHLHIRTKISLLALVFMLFVVVAVFDALLSPGPILFVARMGMIACAVLIYKVLRPAA